MKKRLKKETIIVMKLSSVIAGIVLFTLISLVVFLRLQQLHQKEKKSATEKFMKFRFQTEELFASNTMLLSGYLSLIKTTPNLSANYSERYLNNLIFNNNNSIRNVGTLKDTTIIWNFPLKGNEAAIGKDLANVPQQRDGVLKVKNSLTPVFVGPIDLLQGGQGFISRIPIVLNDVIYWGQLSIVIDADPFLKSVKEFEDRNELELALFSEELYPKKPFYGSTAILLNDPEKMELNFTGATWKAAYIPKGGWKTNYAILLLFLIPAALLSALFGFFLYQLMFSRLRMRQLAVFDQLTGLYNKIFLMEYHHLLFNRAKRNNQKIGIMIIDIIDFRRINYTYGMKTGNEALEAIGERLKNSCRNTEALFRIGCDDFLVLFPDIHSADDMKTIMQRFTDRFTLNIETSQHHLDVHPNIAFTIFPDDAQTIDELISLTYKELIKTGLPVHPHNL